MTKYSFVLPVYKVERYLEECVSSILRQKVSDFEIVLVDDGSPDGCPKICDRLKKEDSRIKVIHQKNSGVSAARNKGLKKASGEYILFVDPDDYIETNYLEIIDNNIKNYDLLIFSYNNLYQNKKTKAFGENSILTKEKAQEYLVEDNKYCGYLWNKVFKKSIIDEMNIKFDTSVSMCEDLLFVYQYMKFIKEAKLIDDAIINYRQRKSSAISKKVKGIDPKSLMKTYDYIMNDAETEFVRIKSESLYLKSYYKYRKYIDKDQFELNKIEKILNNDYDKISSHDKKIINMYKFVPFVRTIIYKMKDLKFHKFD